MKYNQSYQVMLIGEDIETRILFKNALMKMPQPCNVAYHYCLDRAVANTQTAQKPQIIFLDANKSADGCADEVRKIRNSDQFKDCSLVVYDSRSHLRDTYGIFSEGADVFINQPYDFPRLRKVIGSIFDIDSKADRSGANRLNYFL